MQLSGTRDELWDQLATPGLVADLGLTDHLPFKMYPYQYAALYSLAKEYDGGQILEIGGFCGRATLTISLAAPNAQIVSLEPYRAEQTMSGTAGRKNVTVIKTYSFRYLKSDSTVWDMVFVDGNHKRVEQDLPWFNRLRVGGLILFHDYTPDRCLPVYATVNDVGKTLGREPDVLIVDSEKIGMAGFYRGKGETLAMVGHKSGKDEMDILNLGAGNVPRADAVNHDLRKHRPEIDIAWDLNDLPWPWEDESFDLIVARAVLEHLRINLLESVGECWRILRPGGRIYLKLPHWQSDISYIDPTHYWKFSLQMPTLFDPDTEYGRAYAFYTERKWKIIKGPRLNNAKSSIHVTMQVRKG